MAKQISALPLYMLSICKLIRVINILLPDDEEEDVEDDEDGEKHEEDKEEIKEGEEAAAKTIGMHYS